MNERFIETNLQQELYFLEEKDIEAAAQCNADAYLDYALLQGLLGKHFSFEKIQKLWATSMRSLKKEALFVADAPAVRAMAIWLPEGFTGSKVIPFLAAGGLLLPFSALIKMLTYESYSMKLKKKYTNHNCWYLYDLAVKKEFQRQGVATKILNPVLDYFDRTGKDCYLETHNPVNVEIYRKFGFSLLEEGEVPGLQLRHYAMLRRSKY